MTGVGFPRLTPEKSLRPLELNSFLDKTVIQIASCVAADIVDFSLEHIGFWRSVA